MTDQWHYEALRLHEQGIPSRTIAEVLGQRFPGLKVSHVTVMKHVNRLKGEAGSVPVLTPLSSANGEFVRSTLGSTDLLSLSPDRTKGLTERSPAELGPLWRTCSCRFRLWLLDTRTSLLGCLNMLPDDLGSWHCPAHNPQRWGKQYRWVDRQAPPAIHYADYEDDVVGYRSAMRHLSPSRANQPAISVIVNGHRHLATLVDASPRKRKGLMKRHDKADVLSVLGDGVRELLGVQQSRQDEVNPKRQWRMPRFKRDGDSPYKRLGTSSPSLSMARVLDMLGKTSDREPLTPHEQMRLTRYLER
jgi:hypothetical protein